MGLFLIGGATGRRFCHKTQKRPAKCVYCVCVLWTGLALKNPPKKTTQKNSKNPPKKTQKTHLKKPTKNVFFWVLLNFLFFMKIIQTLSREPKKRRPNALQIPLPRRLSWPCVSDLQSIYKAESWQSAVTHDDSTPQCRLCENRCGVSTSLLRSRHHRQVKLAVKT